MAGTVTQTLVDVPGFAAPSLQILSFTWVADSSNGSVPATPTSAAISALIAGRYVVMAVTKPSTPAPTGNYDISITSEDGIDVMGGTLQNRSSTLPEQALPLLDGINQIYGARPIGGALTFTLTNNAVNSAAGVCKIYLSRGA